MNKFSRKMIRKFSIMPLLFASLIGVSQTTTSLDDSMRQNVLSLNNEIKHSTETIKILEQRLTQANETVTNQNSTITSFDTIYTILTIYFAIIAVLIPFLTYQFGIKPSKKQVKNFKANFDRRLEEYLRNTRTESIDKAISNLSSDSAELRQNAITVLSLTNHEGLSEIQYFKLYQALKSTTVDSGAKTTLAFVLTSKENDFATEYCIMNLRSGNPFNEIYSARYFGMIGVEKYIPNFVEYVNRFPDKADSFRRIINSMKSVSLNSVVKLFDSDEIVNLFDNSDFEGMRNFRITNGFERYEENMIRDTKLYNKIFTQ